MMKILKYTEYLYLLVWVLSIGEIYSLWNTDRSKAYVFVVFAIGAAAMFFFKRKYRKKFEKRKSE